MKHWLKRIAAPLLLVALVAFYIFGAREMFAPSARDEERRPDPVISAWPEIADSYQSAIATTMHVTVQKDGEASAGPFTDTKLVVSVSGSWLVPTAQSEENLNWAVRVPGTATSIRALDSTTVNMPGPEGGQITASENWREVVGGSVVSIDPVVVTASSKESGDKLPYSVALFELDIRVSSLDVDAVSASGHEVHINHLRWESPQATWGSINTFEDEPADMFDTDLLADPEQEGGAVLPGGFYQLSVCSSCGVIDTYGADEYDPGSSRQVGAIAESRMTSWTAANRPWSWVFGQRANVAAGIVGLAVAALAAFSRLWFSEFGRPQAAGRRARRG